MQIYWNKRKRLHKKRIQEDCLGTPTWPPFHCFGTPIWRPWRHVKTLYFGFGGGGYSLWWPIRGGFVQIWYVFKEKRQEVHFMVPCEQLWKITKTRHLQQVEGDAAFSKYVKGVPFFHKSYTKEVPFLTKLLCKLGTGFDLGTKPPLYKTFLSTPRPGLGNVQKTRRLSMKSGALIKVNGSWKECLTKFRLTKNWSFGVWSALDVTLLSKLYQTHQVFKHPFYERLYFRGEAETSWGDVFPNWMKRSSHVHAENDNENAYSSSFSEVKSLLKIFRQFHHKLSYRIRLSSFFSPFSVVRPTQIFGVLKKKSSDVVKPFFTWNNPFNLKNEHSNSIEKNRVKSKNIFYRILGILLIQIFNVILGTRTSYSETSSDFSLVCFFFQSDRPTQHQETHSTLNR